MSHINSHLEPRRSKILDHRHRYLFWAGSPGTSRSYSNACWGLDIPASHKKWHARIRRHIERQTWAHLKDFRCAGSLECECLGCVATPLIA